MSSVVCRTASWPQVEVLTLAAALILCVFSFASTGNTDGILVEVARNTLYSTMIQPQSNHVILEHSRLVAAALISQTRAAPSHKTPAAWGGLFEQTSHAVK